MYQFNPSKQYKSIISFLFVILYIVATAHYAFAHEVFFYAYVEGDAIFVEGGFSDGTLCNNAKIEVFDPSGKKLLEGATNEKGAFSFKPTQKTDLKIVLDAGMGHRAEYTIPSDELPEVSSAETRKFQEISEAGARIDSVEIELVVDKVIQKRLRPLIQLLAKSQRKTGVSPTEIFGGIGYILGLMGIAMYFRYRKGGKA